MKGNFKMAWTLEVLMFAWFLSLYHVEGEKDDKCFDNCKCCKNEKCHTGFNDWTNVCTYGCIDGHRGARCYELCTHNCTSCNEDIDICEGCYDGFYLGPDADCTSECPTSCKACTSNDRCTACKQGYYDRDGSRTCSYYHCPLNCVCNNNACDGCKNGFFDIDTSCSKKCPSNCLICSTMNLCSVCKNDYYNGHEFDNTLKPELQNCTYKCRDTCTGCTSYNNCIQCINGKYGKICQHDCSIGCKDATCHIESGICTCSFNFIGDNCTECATGRYGTYCNKSCPANCKNSRCEKSSGICTDGCITNTIIGEKCDICSAGMHGALCDKICPQNCKDKICDRNNTECSKGCTGNFDGKFCEICKRGKYGAICDSDCPARCANVSCEKDIGSCFSCTGNFDGHKCEVCKHGFYGLNCDVTCSVYCLNKSCSIDSGECDNGCTNNYSGDKCCVYGKNCIGCASNIECNKCTPGYFEKTCEDSCPPNCLDSCDFTTGVCRDCIPNHYGDFCNLTCSENCNVSRNTENSNCASTDGECVFGCKYGFFGPTCTETCSSLCIDSICTQEKGICIKGCKDSFEDPVCALMLEKRTPSSAGLPIGPIVGGIAGAIAFVVVGLLAVICLIKRRRRANQDQQSKDANSCGAKEEGHVYQNFHGKETQLFQDDVGQNSTLSGADNTVDVDDVDIDKRSNDDENKPNDSLYINESTRVKVTNLFSYVTNRDDDSFANEFQNLSKGLDLDEHCTFARRPENIGLNRYNGMYPYDHSRVTIPGQPGFFINACYIDGYKRQKAYIASLGPTAKTTEKFSAFWRMVWHEKSDIIVMLTNLREASGMKCERYWPELEKEDGYGQINVKCRSIEEFAEYTVRTLSISKGKEQRNLLQLHYTAWPDKGVPQEVTSLEEFRQRVKAVPSTLGGPVIVHCSAGVGRTGTYLALDMLTEEGNREGYVDVFNCVNKMRQQRVNMVQTAEQYRFLYKTLVHALSFGSKAITAEEIQGFLYKADDRVFTDMFQTLRQEVDIEKQEDLDEREENRRRHKDKNRRHSDIPSNRNRVRLYFLRGDGHHDYINAVFINSFKIKDLFIAAQSPLPLTVEDFLCMIYQQDSTCVVALEDPRNQNNDVGKYLPADNETYKCGDYTVTSSKCETKQQYILKKLSIENTRKRGAKTVHHFQYNKWGHSLKVPDSVADFVHFIKDVENCLRKHTSDTRHIVVHCLSGYERSGLFCVVYKLLEKLDAERQVSVVNTVRKIRTHRRQAISCVEQLKFCYQSISSYLEINNTYTNFTA